MFAASARNVPDMAFASSRPMAWFSPEAGHRACLLIALQYLHGRILLAKL
jgi:hypothetical protein